MALAEALAALALVGIAAVGTARLLPLAVHTARDAERLDRARVAAETILNSYRVPSWRALPGAFGASNADSQARLDTELGSLPAAWVALTAGLPKPRIVATLEGLDLGGTPRSFSEAVALRIVVTVDFELPGERRRAVRLTTMRY